MVVEAATEAGDVAMAANVVEDAAAAAAAPLHLALKSYNHARR